MTHDRTDPDFGPVGAAEEDLEQDPEYDHVTPATVTPGPASPQVDDLPGEQQDSQHR